jgi:hypothetical protein
VIFVVTAKIIYVVEYESLTAVAVNEFLTAVAVKNSVLWNVRLQNPVKSSEF